MRSIGIFLMTLASVAAAGFLPLIHDRPKRDNPFDPAAKPLQLPVAAFPTFTPTPTPGPACGGPDSAGAFASFESTADGFVADTCCTNFVAHSPALSATTFCKGTQSLCSSATIDSSGDFKQLVFKREFGSFQDWSGQELAVWAYFNPDWQQASAQVYIKSTSGFVYSNGPITHPPASGGWTRVLFDLNGAPQYIAGATNTAQVREVGLQVYVNQGEGRPDGALEICLDEFVAQ
jgi:hypothetical protein